MNKKRLLSSVLLVSILTVNVKANHYNFDKNTTDDTETVFNKCCYIIMGTYNIGANVGVEATSSNTKKEIRTVTITRKEESDNLGSVKIYFYDPIIESKTSATQYQVRTYNTGNVKFGISAY